MLNEERVKNYVCGKSSLVPELRCVYFYRYGIEEWARSGVDPVVDVIAKRVLRLSPFPWLLRIMLIRKSL